MLQDPYPNAFFKTIDGKKLKIKVAELENFYLMNNKKNILNTSTSRMFGSILTDMLKDSYNFYTTR